jgi:hypothetical protein
MSPFQPRLAVFFDQKMCTCEVQKNISATVACKCTLQTIYWCKYVDLFCLIYKCEMECMKLTPSLHVFAKLLVDHYDYGHDMLEIGLRVEIGPQVTWYESKNIYISANSSESSKSAKIDKNLIYVKPKILSTACSFDIIFFHFRPPPQMYKRAHRTFALLHKFYIYIP